MSRQLASRLVRQVGLASLAARLRAKEGVSGRRDLKRDPLAHRVTAAMKRLGSQVQAARALRITRARLQRVLARLH